MRTTYNSSASNVRLENPHPERIMPHSHCARIRAWCECRYIQRCWKSVLGRLVNVIAVGTTLFECKSGYGLSAEAELKMLRVIEKSRDQIIPDVSVTYCAAHAVPE